MKIKDVIAQAEIEYGEKYAEFLELTKKVAQFETELAFDKARGISETKSRVSAENLKVLANSKFKELKSLLSTYTKDLLQSVVDELGSNPNEDGSQSPNIQHWIEQKQMRLRDIIKEIKAVTADEIKFVAERISGMLIAANPVNPIFLINSGG